MGVWETLRGELATATGREFERRALPLLRLFDNEMTPAPEMQGLDRAGIDILVWSDDRKFAWAVQCKGFKENEDIGQAQVKQIIKSIEKFRQSSFSCKRYVLLHNRTGENRDAVQLVEEALARLRKEGKAEDTYLWDRQKFINEARTRLKNLIIERMNENTNRLLSKQEELFRFGDVYVEQVPISEKQVTIDRHEGIRISSADAGPARRRVAELALQPSAGRWTMLVGEFGTGKTSAALHAARQTARQMIYVPAESMTDREGSVGTNIVLARAVEAVHLFDDFDDETRLLVHKVAGRTLAGVLTGRDSGYVLVIDGLDENRVYSRADGLQRLTNELAELQCSTVLTTRKAHFDSMFSTFGRAFEDLSIKGGKRPSARLIELELWGDQEINDLMASVVNIATPDEKEHLKCLQNSISNGEAYSFYGDLLKHPLFFQMILEEVANGRIEKANRAELVRRWMIRKIRRDVKVSRETPTEIRDVDTFAEEMMLLHERVAYRMTSSENDTKLLMERIDSNIVEEEAQKLFGTKVDISSLLSYSLLSAVSIRSRGSMPVKFLLRICQEFYLASHLHRKGEGAVGYPEAVVSLWKEIQEGYSI
jgi:hypothetical protein